VGGGIECHDLETALKERLHEDLHAMGTTTPSMDEHHGAISVRATGLARCPAIGSEHPIAFVQRDYFREAKTTAALLTTVDLFRGGVQNNWQARNPVGRGASLPPQRKTSRAVRNKNGCIYRAEMPPSSSCLVRRPVRRLVRRSLGEGGRLGVGGSLGVGELAEIVEHDIFWFDTQTVEHFSARLEHERRAA
jgi:hypothetical protein